MLVLVDPCSPLMLIRKNNKTATESLCTHCEHCTRIVSFFYPVLKHGSCLLVSKYPPKYYVAVGLYTVGRKVWNFIHSPPTTAPLLLPHRMSSRFPFATENETRTQSAITGVVRWNPNPVPVQCSCDHHPTLADTFEEKDDDDDDVVVQQGRLLWWFAFPPWHWSRPAPRTRSFLSAISLSPLA